jgi:hypothetical protein
MGGQPAPPQQPQQSPAGPAFNGPTQGPPQGFTGQQQPQQFVGQQMPQQQPGGGQPNYNQNPFAGITSGDQSNQRHPFLEDGDYKLKISGIKLLNARSGKTHYIIEGDILASNNPLCPPGMRVSCFINMSNKDMASKHCSAFVASVFGHEPASLPKDTPHAPWTDTQTGQQMPWAYYLEMSVSDAQPWVGADAAVNVRTIGTQNGGEFSLHTWHPAATFVIPAMAAPSQHAQQAAPPPPQVGGTHPSAWGGQPQQQPQQAPWGAVPPTQPGFPPQGGGWNGGQ